MKLGRQFSLAFEETLRFLAQTRDKITKLTKKPKKKEKGKKEQK